MTSKIFRSILTASVTVLAATLIIITGFLYDYFTQIQREQLKDELYIASVGTENAGIEYLEDISLKNYRLTLIDKDGKVLFDSVKDVSEMENHLNREEIKEAFEKGKGSSSRYSSTLTEKTLYEAILLSDGTVLRISVSRASGMTLMLGMVYPIIIIAIIAIVLSAVLANKMSKRITEPLNKLDLDNPLENDTYEEITPLLKRISRQNSKIERKVAELKRKKDEFAYVTDNMREGLVLMDKDKHILSINPAAMTLFGADENCIGNEFITIDRKHDMIYAIDKALSDGHCEIKAIHNEREYQFEISRIENENDVVGTVLLAFDITEQANAERMRREFSANVSHELKTPLQSITGSAELMENGLVKPEDMPRFIGHIHKEAKRLVTLVDDIIRLSQLDEGGDMPKEEVSLYAVAKDVFETLKNSAKEKNISLDISGDNGNIFGVKHLLYEIIYNLCDNAINYNTDGGKVDVTISENDKGVTLSVSDTGIGIPSEHQQRIFERFYRVDKSHSKKSGGTGLGLSIVKHAVLFHNGRISVESAENKGTTITVTFPKTK